MGRVRGVNPKQSEEKICHNSKKRVNLPKDRIIGQLNQANIIYDGICLIKEKLQEIARKIILASVTSFMEDEEFKKLREKLEKVNIALDYFTYLSEEEK